MDKRKLITKKELICIIAVLLFAALVLLLLKTRGAGEMVVIERDGEVIAEKKLADVQELEQIAVESRGVLLSVEVNPSGVSVASSTCPDKLCVKAGEISRTGSAVVCLPARVSVKIIGKSGADAVTY